MRKVLWIVAALALGITVSGCGKDKGVKKGEGEEGVRAILPLLTREELAWAVRAGDTALLEQANALLGGWQTEGRLDSLIKKWLPYYAEYDLRADAE